MLCMKQYKGKVGLIFQLVYALDNSFIRGINSLWYIFKHTSIFILNNTTRINKLSKTCCRIFFLLFTIFRVYFCFMKLNAILKSNWPSVAKCLRFCLPGIFFLRKSLGMTWQDARGQDTSNITKAVFLTLKKK